MKKNWLAQRLFSLGIPVFWLIATLSLSFNCLAQTAKQDGASEPTLPDRRQGEQAAEPSIVAPSPSSAPQTRQPRTPESQQDPQRPAAKPNEPKIQAAPPRDDLEIDNPPVITKVEALAGRPFGLGKISFRLRAGDEMVDRTASILLSDRENRTLYPVITKSAFQQFLQNISGNRNDAHPEDMHHLWFLFKGDTPLDISLTGSGFVNLSVPVQVARPRQFKRFVDQWWKGFSEATQKQIESSDYPPIVETYLTTMISKRLGLDVRPIKKGNPDPLFQTFELLFNAESIRLETIEDSMFNGVDPSVASQPVPSAIQWTPLVVNNLPKEVAVESIANYVPEECFYLRFGTWSNQVWMRKLMEEHGGDLDRMIQLRGFKYRIQSKFLKQLAIESTEFDLLFGGNLIADVALIGKDTFFNDGAAVGVMLYSRNTRALEGNLRGKRKSFAQAHAAEGAKLENIEVDGHQIEFLSTPDNLYRSYYVVRDDCHLMTTSLAIVKRFLESSKGIRSLGKSDEFKFARYQIPLDREDTLFVYMSSRFMQELLLPQYQIELRRRNRVVTDMMLYEIAALAGRNEQIAGLDIQSLIQNGFLPQNFSSRPDNGAIQLKDKVWIDSLRGRRGYFTPIADMELSAVTPEEVRWYQNRAAFFADSIRSLDPMLLAVKRFDYQNKVERVVFDGKILPFGVEKFGWAMDKLGPPTKKEVVTHPNEIIRVQINMKGDSANPDVSSHLIFGAIQDEFEKDLNLKPNSILGMYETLKTTPGYLGSWPTAGYIDWIPGIGRDPDKNGFSYSRLLKLWRLQWKDFSILSFDQDRLENLKPHLQVIESARPVQIRLKVGDLANSKLKNWANRINFQRGWQTSIANVRFLNLLIQQFRVRPEASKEIAERLLDVELVCSLGGEYSLKDLKSGRMQWYSNAWPSFLQPDLPESHSAPLLKWFRGMELEVSQTKTQFTIHGYMDIERQDESSVLPKFDLFKGFGTLFGGEK